MGNLLGTIWLFNIAMENGPFIDDFPIKTSIYEGFSMAMLNNQRVTIDVLMWVSPKSLGIPPNIQNHPTNKSHKMELKATS